MATFRYTAIDTDGRAVSGKIEAENSVAATAQLEADGLRVESIEPIPPASTPANERDVRLSTGDLVQLGGQIADITASELPLASGLAALRQELPRGRLRRALGQIVLRLEKGDELESVLKRHTRSDDVIALLRAGTRSGRTSEVLGQYITYSRRLADLKSTVLMVLSYPVILLLTTSLICGVVLLGLVPMFKNIFVAFDTELPSITVLLIEISDLAVIVVPWLAGGLIALVLVGWLCIVSSRGRIGLGYLLRQVPLVGSMFYWTSLSSYVHLLAILIEHELPMPDALLLAGDSAASPRIRRASHRLSQEISQGEPPSTSLVALSGLPASLIQVLMWKEHKEAMADALHALGEMFLSRARFQSWFFPIILGPSILIFVCLSIGFVTLALFMPLIKLLNDMS